MGRTIEVAFIGKDYDALCELARRDGVGPATFLADLAKERIDNPLKAIKPPAGFEFTGETRLPKKGEWFLDRISSEPCAVLANLGFMLSKCRILRQIPRPSDPNAKPPDGYEFTGETRPPKKGEWFVHPGHPERAVMPSRDFESVRTILRPIPCVPSSGPCVRCHRQTANKLGDTWTCDDCRMAYGEDVWQEEATGVLPSTILKWEERADRQWAKAVADNAEMIGLLREIRDRLPAKDVDKRPQP